MSDDWIVIIPEDPDAVPDPQLQQRARDLLAQFAPDSEEISVESYDQIQFFDCGGNFSRVLCPSCSVEIPVDWWQDRMAEDYADGFAMSDYSTPCCGVSCNLNSLVYDWPQGFARFSLQAMNPNIGNLQDEACVELAAALGLPIRVIYRHI